MLKRKIISFLFLMSFLFTSCLTDLRTDFVKLNEVNATQNKKGRQILESVLQQDNMAILKTVNSYSVDFSDTFLNLKGAIANPYKSKETKFKLNYTPNTFNGKMTILSGKEKGKEFSYINGETHELKGVVFEPKKNKRTEFWLPTYQYFIEFPMRILNADKITYAGEKEYNSTTYDLVLVSWKTFEPQKKIDQYLVWVNKKTNQIDILQYTIRDYYGFIQGVTYMSKYKKLNGINVPTVMKVKSKMTDKKLMHIMRINGIQFN